MSHAEIRTRRARAQRLFLPGEPPVITRAAKILLLAGLALFYTLVVFNNLTDPDSNYQFVRHVLSMDSTFPGNRGLWRALPSPAMHVAFFASIIAWEVATTVLLWLGVEKLTRSLRLAPDAFNAAKRIPLVALTLSMLMWLVAFLSVGAEWFLMWQSHTWNGQEAAFRMFSVTGVVFLILMQPETDHQP
jgi:predicted small integral membrane protein